MAIETVPLTGKLTAPGSGGIAVRGTVAAFPNTTNYALSFSADNENTLGPVVADVAADGTFELDIPVNSDQQAELLWTIVVKTSERVPGLNKTVTWTPGTFAISAAVDLADLEAVAVTSVSETVLADFAQMVTDAETARDEAVAVGNTNDTIIAGRINDPASETSGALSATIVTETRDITDLAASSSALGNSLTKVGVVIDLGTGADPDADMAEGLTVSYCPENGRLAGTYVGYTDAGGSMIGVICLAWSDDGITWEKDGVLLAGSGTVGAPDRYGATGPVIIFDGGLYHLFYIGLDATGYEGGTKRLCHATSPSLVTPVWTRNGAILTPGGTGWREYAVYHPSIVKKGDTWYCFINCAADDGSGTKYETIGYATAPALAGPWTFDDVNSPLIGNVGSTYITGDPCVTKVPGGWRMDFFRVHAGVFGSDYYATTSDDDFPLGWVEGNGGSPILTSSEEYDSKYAHKPFIYRHGGRVFHYYTAVAITGTRRTVALAVDPPLTAPPSLASESVTGWTTAERLESLLSALANYDLDVAPLPTAADSFTRANGALAGSTTEVGAKTWVVGGGTGFNVTSNQLAWTGATDGQAMVNSGLSDNWEMRVTLVSITGQYPVGLVYGSSATSFVKLYRDQTTNNWVMVDSTGAGSAGKPIATDIVNGDTLRLRKQGTTYGLLVNDVLIAEWFGFTYHNTAADTFQGILGAGTRALTVDDFSVGPIP